MLIPEEITPSNITDLFFLPMNFISHCFTQEALNQKKGGGGEGIYNEDVLSQMAIVFFD